MSWESVVDDVAPSVDPAGDPPLGGAPSGAAPPASDASASLTTQPATTPLTPPAPYSFSSASTLSADPLPMQSEPVIETAPLAPLTLDPPPTAPADEPPIVLFAPMKPIVAAITDPMPTAVADPMPTAVAVADVADALVVPATDSPSTELPQIVEATPVPDGTPLDGLGGFGPQISAGPRLPQDQQVTPAPTSASAFEMPVEYAPVASGSRGRRKSRRGLKLLLTLAILGGLVAAGIVFGRPYLFPDGWDEATRPYAEAVETARGVEFVAPIAVIAEPTADYTKRLGGELVGDWSVDEPVLRALGLLNGPTTEESTTELLADWQNAVYSTADGQVYTDAGVAGAQLDAEITEEMTAASLDQEFRWSTQQPSRTLDDQVLTLAEVQRQAAGVLAKTPFATALEPLAPGVLAFVPPIVGYRALAPATFAEFQNPAGGAENSLSQMGTAGPGPLVSEVPVAAGPPTMIGTDTLVGSPRSLDRAFWFLVFAGFLDSRAAYQASESVVESSVVTADRAGTQCVYATFSGGDVLQTDTLRSALGAWSASAPIELAANVSVLADGTLQLVSCDPGVGFETSNRLGAARELVGWRTAELATLEAVRTSGG
ncbi:MAG TPA: hypothetical protein VES40_11775, partial [Ilumatobacteraceae bacterium]|nr:hypothetical protein [Ilumatobacteraceae bacterium]